MCPFCAIVAGTAPAGIVAESGRALAFMDLRQPLPGQWSAWAATAPS